MFPKILSIGDFYLPAYGALVALGVLAGLKVSGALAKRRGMDVEVVSNLVVVCALSGLAGAKLAMIIFDWESHYRQNVADIFSISTLQAAGVFQGGLILAILAAWWYMRRHGLPFLKTADVLALRRECDDSPLHYISSDQISRHTAALQQYTLLRRARLLVSRSNHPGPVKSGAQAKVRCGGEVCQIWIA